MLFTCTHGFSVVGGCGAYVVYSGQACLFTYGVANSPSRLCATKAIDCLRLGYLLASRSGIAGMRSVPHLA